MRVNCSFCVVVPGGFGVHERVGLNMNVEPALSSQKLVPGGLAASRQRDRCCLSHRKEANSRTATPNALGIGLCPLAGKSADGGSSLTQGGYIVAADDHLANDHKLANR